MGIAGAGIQRVASVTVSSALVGFALPGNDASSSRALCGASLQLERVQPLSRHRAVELLMVGRCILDTTSPSKIFLTLFQLAVHQQDESPTPRARPRPNARAGCWRDEYSIVSDTVHLPGMQRPAACCSAAGATLFRCFQLRENDQAAVSSAALAATGAQVVITFSGVKWRMPTWCCSVEAAVHYCRM